MGCGSSTRDYGKALKDRPPKVETTPETAPSPPVTTDLPKSSTAPSPPATTGDDEAQFFGDPAKKSEATSNKNRRTWVPTSRFSCVAGRSICTSERHLVLNFDVNTTIIMMDSVSKKKSQHVINSVIANSTWGVVVDDLWVADPAYPEPCIKRPAPGLMSYIEYLESTYPGRTNQKARNQLAQKFTEEGAPGAHLAEHHAEMVAKLKLPEHVVGTPEAAAAGLQTGSHDEVFIIPSFFELLLSLRQAERSFCLVFRTFGEDLQDIGTELNAFCEGRHPCWPGIHLDGTDPEFPYDYRIKFKEQDKCGNFWRGPEGDALVLGSLDQPNRDGDLSLSFWDEAVKKGEARVIGPDPPNSFEALGSWLQEATSARGTLAFRDYFPHWANANRASHAGKLLLYDSSPEKFRHEIFFDDNVRYDDAKIIDARDLNMPDKQPWINNLLHKHIVRAEPLESVRDPQYFISHLDRLESNYIRACKARASLRKLLRRAYTRGEVGRRISVIASWHMDWMNEKYDPWEGMRTFAMEYSMAQDQWNDDSMSVGGSRSMSIWGSPPL